jgi:hypothetical protein
MHVNGLALKDKDPARKKASDGPETHKMQFLRPTIPFCPGVNKY